MSFSSSSHHYPTARPGSSSLSSNLRRNRSASDVYLIDNRVVNTSGSRLSSGDPRRFTRDQRSRRAFTYPYPSDTVAEESSNNVDTSSPTPDPPLTVGLTVSQSMPTSERPRVQQAESSRTVGPRPESGYPQMDPAMERIMRDHQRRQRRTLRGRVRRIRAFLGLGPGNRARKEIVQLLWTLGFGFTQFSVTIAFMALAAAHRSPRDPSISEWKACDKPLGAWNIVWLVKVLLDCSMSYWSWIRNRKIRRLEQQNQETGIESGNNPPAPQNTIGIQPMEPDAVDQESQANEESLATNAARERRRRQERLPFANLFNRLHVLLTCLIVTWFITANIFIYTSLRTCRFAAPHLWWLTFSILSIQYFMIFEVFAIATIVFIIGPLVFLFWNILLLCVGRHPLQNPHYINPAIRKSPKAEVDKIPLVIYIPPPPEEDGEEELKVKENKSVPGNTQPDDREKQTGSKEEIVIEDVQGEPSAFEVEKQTQEETHEKTTHTYPPESPPSLPKTTKISRFSLFPRLSSKTVQMASSSGGDPPSQGAWEDTWERGNSRLPFIRLAGNRAVCAICLTDFEAPKRRVARNVIRSWSSSFGNLIKNGGDAKSEAEKGSEDMNGEGTSARVAEVVDTSMHEVHASSIRTPVENTTAGTLRLVDAGEGPQPLRLLPCGHVFHKTCIDPWLLDVSGRCPTCQRPVLLPGSSTKKARETSRS